MDFIEGSIFERVIRAIRRIYIYDKELLNYEVKQDPLIHERTLSSRLAMYLQEYFSDYKVDCEYNRHINDVKRIGKDIIYPDIIIHNRKSDANNLIWIEVKKSTSKDAEKKLDRGKLKKATLVNGEYKYRYGVFIIFDKNMSNCKVEIYKEGELTSIDLTRIDFCDK